MFLVDKFKNYKRNKMMLKFENDCLNDLYLSDEDVVWNKFIYEVCERDLDTLSVMGRNAVLCYFYDSEMNNGGHKSYFDWYRGEIEIQFLEDALLEIGNKDILSNYKEALEYGENDDYQRTDDVYFSFEPSLEELLNNYVVINKDEIFREAESVE